MYWAFDVDVHKNVMACRHFLHYWPLVRGTTAHWWILHTDVLVSWKQAIKHTGELTVIYKLPQRWWLWDTNISTVSAIWKRNTLRQYIYIQKYFIQFYLYFIRGTKGTQTILFSDVSVTPSASRGQNHERFSIKIQIRWKIGFSVTPL